MNMVMGAASHDTTKEIQANDALVMSGNNLQIEAMASSYKTDGGRGKGLGFNQAKEAVTH